MVELGSRFVDAVAWAVELHQGQVRKATEVPYVAHLLSVAALVLDQGGDEEQAIVALLHDALEDTDITRADIEDRFGADVAAAVARCSDTEVRPKPPWRERKEQFLARLSALGPDETVLRVVAADKLHNARSLVADHRRFGDALWERFNAGYDDQLWYHRQVAALVRDGLGGPAADALDAAVADLADLGPGA